MKIERVDTARYSLPLARRYRVGRVDTDKREGRLVRLTADDGTQGYGEIAPLPGLHSESLRDVDEVLRTLGPGLEGRVFGGFDAFAQNVANRVAACAPHGEFGCPSVVFGLQTAGMALLARQADTTPAAILAPTPLDQVAVNALFVGGPVQAAEAVAGGTLDAYPVVKVKCGLLPPEAERQMLEILLTGLPDETLLRLDANRALGLADAVRRFRGLPPERIQYLEEPLANPVELADLHARTGLSIGLDETLYVPSLFDIGRAGFVAAWCIKPARVGHWQRMVFLAREAERHGAAIVVTSCLESGLGLSAQAQLAAALPGRAAACGLGTEDWLRLDIVTPPYDASAGVVHTRAWRGTPSARVLDKLRFQRAC